MDINDAWKSTCRAVLGGEVGTLDEFESYLKEYDEPMAVRSSVLSGKPVAVIDPEIGKNARFISNSEIALYSEGIGSKPLDINDIKDIDSLARAVSERWAYAGDIVLGRSEDYANCDQCSNLMHSRDCGAVSDSQFNAHANLSRVGEYIFGSSFLGESSYLIRVFYAYRAVRCFESLRLMVSSDCHYSANLEGCVDCLFSFNLRNASYRIGNLALPKSEYQDMKAALFSQVRDQLKAKKKALSVLDLLSLPLSGPPAPPTQGPAKHGQAEADRPARGPASLGPASRLYFESGKPIPAQIEDAFRSTCRVLLGRALEGRLEDYEPWLIDRVRIPLKTSSAMSGRRIYAPKVAFIPKTLGRCVGLDESLPLGGLEITREALASLSLANAGPRLAPIAFWTCEAGFGNNHEVVDVDECGDSHYCYRGSVYWYSKNCCYDFWSRDAEAVFGSDLVFYSKTCIKCFGSNHLNRCFEVSRSLNCADCYFCHNVESCHECMFCFNVKAKRYAIGNVEMKKEDYMRVKKLVLNEIGARLENDKKLDIDIYNIGARHGHQ